ncbi:hypothetical protein PTTG_12254 [Puccinia triticina 1-1 BBBD Race 1]|uniref:Uncharacterized protein n=2 Tax=Puccinia triticina TaxID=208348 RepID=A0A180H5I3_PUCT1|nr:uncharacterized protein PtA15_2A644 [Puccinia triticina]OAV99829.1 hypothetical protein PTTG_12254 [Puccinia triticina 1-1 BBBD Race 1]WAQ82327.1 hypothetical protein PtA15_2A644 [Puccinia triticina]
MVGNGGGNQVDERIFMHRLIRQSSKLWILLAIASRIKATIHIATGAAIAHEAGTDATRLATAGIHHPESCDWNTVDRVVAFLGIDSSPSPTEECTSEMESSRRNDFSEATNLNSNIRTSMLIPEGGSFSPSVHHVDDQDQHTPWVDWSQLKEGGTEPNSDLHRTDAVGIGNGDAYHEPPNHFNDNKLFGSAKHLDFGKISSRRAKEGLTMLDYNNQHSDYKHHTHPSWYLPSGNVEYSSGYSRYPRENLNYYSNSPSLGLSNPVWNSKYSSVTGAYPENFRNEFSRKIRSPEAGRFSW